MIYVIIGTELGHFFDQVQPTLSLEENRSWHHSRREELIGTIDLCEAWLQLPTSLPANELDCSYYLFM